MCVCVCVCVYASVCVCVCVCVYASVCVFNSLKEQGACYSGAIDVSPIEQCVEEGQ